MNAKHCTISTVTKLNQCLSVSMVFFVIGSWCMKTRSIIICDPWNQNSLIAILLRRTPSFYDSLVRNAGMYAESFQDCARFQMYSREIFSAWSLNRTSWKFLRISGNDELLRITKNSGAIASCVIILVWPVTFYGTTDTLKFLRRPAYGVGHPGHEKG